MSDDGETRQLKRFGKWAAIGALAVVVLGIGVRASNRYSLSTIAADNEVPTVAVIRPKRSAGGSELALPGMLQAFNTDQI